MTRRRAEHIELPARRVLRIGRWANIAIAAAHVLGLIWAWSLFRAVGIEAEMHDLARQAAALPYVLTVITAGAFAVFGSASATAMARSSRRPRGACERRG